MKMLIYLLMTVATIVAAAECSKPHKAILVYDKEYILDSVQEKQLNNLYLTHEKKTTNQIVLITTSSFEPDTTIEQYALRNFNTLGIGQKDKNNGVLIVFSSTLRQVRIATGYGTEKVLTDSIAQSIIGSSMIPHFKTGDLFEGLWNGSSEIVKFLEKPENEIK